MEKTFQQNNYPGELVETPSIIELLIIDAFSIPVQDTHI